ncbi:MAG: SIR2 family protein [Thermodesulfovibrionales bacterium]|nr:SIR2 family protein [Thermodesulfovibrionales bacterium]
MSDLISSGSNGIEKEVEALVRNRGCVIFMGAGLSIPPSGNWSSTAKEFAKYCGVRASKGKEKETIDKCIKKNPSKFDDKFRDLFQKDNAAQRTAYTYLIKLHFKAWVTTNFDPWFHNNTPGSNINFCKKYPDISMNTGLSNRLFYIHGYFNSEDKNCFAKDMVFGKRSFKEAYGPDSLLPGFLLNLFTYENVIFVGFDPSEEYIRDVIERSNHIRGKIQRQTGVGITTKRYIMWKICEGISDKDREEWKLKISLFNSLEIIPFLYNPIEKDHRGLETIFRNWVGKFVGSPAPFESDFAQ